MTMKYFFWIAFAVFLAASIPHVAYFFASFEPSGGPEGIWWWAVSYAIAISIDVTIYLLSWTAFQRYRRYRSTRAVWQHWLLIIMCTVFSWAVNWAYAKQFHSVRMLSAAEATAPWLTTVFAFMASAFPLLGLVYTLMAETLSETEAQEKQERTQQFTELAELAKRTDLPLTTLRRALSSGPRFNAASLLTITDHARPEPTIGTATPPVEVGPPGPNPSMTSRIATVAGTDGTGGERVNGVHPANALDPSSPFTAGPHGGNPDKLQLTIEAIRANPAITDEALAEYLALKRPASARFWRQKAIEIVNTPGSQTEGRQRGQTAPSR
jgi:hypothetical protein